MKKKVIIIYSSAEWSDEPYLNVHYYTRELSKLGYRVIFIESIGLRKPNVKKSIYDKLRVFKRLIRLIFVPLRKRGNIFILTPIYYPNRHLNLLFSTILNLQLFLLSDFKKQIAWVFLPSFWYLIRDKKFYKLIYHAVDNYEENPNVNKKEIRYLEREILKKANYILSTSKPLLEKFNTIITNNKRLKLFDNKIVDCHLKEHTNFILPFKVKHPALVYVGNIAHYKLDFELLYQLIENNKHINFYFIGPKNKGEEDMNIPFAHYKNVYLYDEIPHRYILDVLKKFDGGIMPYKITNSTMYSFPLKYMEFLYAGLPIFSTKLPSLKNEKFIIFIEKNSKIYIPKIDKKGIISYAKNFCWEKRIKEVLKYIGE